MKLTKKLAELVGIIIGDGHICRHKNSYRIGFTGNPKTDKSYFKLIKNLIWIVWRKQSKIVKRGRGLRITFGSKKVFEELVYDLGLPYGEGKCERVKIPETIAKEWKFVKWTIREIVDTDGSVFAVNKPGAKNYPSIEITTSSYSLATQLKQNLTQRKFRVAKIWQYKSKLSRRTTYKVPLNGRKNLAKWIKEIGFSNPNKLKKAISIIKKVRRVGFEPTVPR